MCYKEAADVAVFAGFVLIASSQKHTEMAQLENTLPLGFHFLHRARESNAHRRGVRQKC
jgi:hypothetical protein